MVWVTLVSITVVAALFTAVYLVWGMTTFVIIGALVTALLATALFYRYAHIFLQETEVGILFDHHGNFVRFLPSGPHTINPLRFELRDRLTKGAQSAKGTSTLIRTKEGIPVTVSWSVSFTIKVEHIKDGIEHKMARALPKYASNMVGGHMVHALQHEIEKMSIKELHAAGATQQLEATLREEVHKRTSFMGVQPFSPSNIKIGPIEMPQHVENALEINYERELNVGALHDLREALARFDDDHMRVLGELERLRIIDSHHPYIYMTDAGNGASPAPPRRSVGYGSSAPSRSG